MEILSEGTAARIRFPSSGRLPKSLPAALRFAFFPYLSPESLKSDTRFVTEPWLKSAQMTAFPDPPATDVPEWSSFAISATFRGAAAA